MTDESNPSSPPPLPRSILKFRLQRKNWRVINPADQIAKRWYRCNFKCHVNRMTLTQSRDWQSFKSSLGPVIISGSFLFFFFFLFDKYDRLGVSMYDWNIVDSTIAAIFQTYDILVRSNATLRLFSGFGNTNCARFVARDCCDLLPFKTQSYLA